MDGTPLIRLLGAVAAAARRVGLRRGVRSATGIVDAALLRLGRLPLSARIGEVTVGGYLRHRSFLSEAARPRETYRELYQRLLRPRMTVIDGGAHVGLYTLLAAHAVGAAGTVIALEPDRYNLAALRLNVARAGATNVEIVADALAEGHGQATFYETRSTIGSSLTERGDSAARTVHTTSVDLLLAGRSIDSLLVKLNIEGAEARALAGMRETLARIEPVAIFFEVNPPLLEAAGTDVDALLDGLRAQRFDVSYIELATQTLVPVPAPLPKGHLLATRASSLAGS